MKAGEVFEKAMKLPERERASLASQLLKSIDQTDCYVSDEEVHSRIAEAKSNPSVMLSLEEFTQGIQHCGG